MSAESPPLPFEARFPVRFHDVDHAGIIFFAKILEYCHVAFEDLIAALGYAPGRFFGGEGFGAPFVHAGANFFAPLRHGDVMVIRVCIARLGRSSMGVKYTLSNQDGVLCTEVSTTQAFVDMATMKPIPIPTQVRRLLERAICPTPADGDPVMERSSPSPSRRSS